MLADISSVGFKVENFNHENMQKLESLWPKIRSAITTLSASDSRLWAELANLESR